MSTRACSACGTPNPPDARFCNGCGARLEPSAAPVAETRRTVTIVFVDVAGSTALGERLDPETLRALIGSFFDLARAVVERHGGIVEKFIGDAVMAVFGLPTLHEDDALRAVRAAAELRDRLAASALAGRLTIRTGVNTGEVVASAAAGDQRLVTGDPVNTAARLEQAAGPGEILLGAPTYRLVREAVRAVEAPSIDARGKADPVRAWRLEGVDSAAEAAPRHLDAPLVGRERELTRLLRAYDDVVAERRCGLFTLLGPAGVGKSRLVHELVQRVSGEAHVLRGRSLPYGEGITYWPIAEMVRAAGAIADADDRDTAVAKLRGLIADQPDADELAERLATAIGISGGETDRDDVFRAVRRLFEALAADRPLVAVFDDLQWAEPTLVDLVEHVADWSRGSPILLVILARPELLDARPDWGGGKLDAQTVLLEALGESDTRQMAQALLGGDVDTGLLDRIEAVAEGNPLFVEQLVAMLVEDGLVVRDADRWRPTAELREVEVPPTITALLAARLDRLPPDERVLAERASVVGRVFERIAVSELSPPLERDAVTGKLRNLVRRELIRPDQSSPIPEETFRFRHILIRDAAYEALSKRDRAELHERFADWLESTTGGRLAEYEEIVGYHLEQAIRYRDELGLDDDATAALRERAFRRLAEAGYRAADRSDLTAAAGLLHRAVTLGPAGAEGSIEARLELGTALLDIERYPEATDAFDAARSEAEQRGDAVAASRATILGAITVAAGDPTISAEALAAIADRHAALIEDAGDDRALFDLWVCRGIAALTQSQWARAMAAYEHALAAADRLGQLRRRELVHIWIGNALIWGPTPVAPALERANQLRERTESRRSRAHVAGKMATLLAYADRIDDARAMLAEALAGFEELGSDGGIGLILVPAEIEATAGDLTGAVRALEDGRRRLEAVGETGVRSTVEGRLSMLLAQLGRDHEALEQSRASEADAAVDDMASQMSLLAGRALATAHLGDPEAAIAIAEAAVAIAEQTDQLVADAEVRMVQAEVLRLAGRADEARAALDAARTRFEAKGHVPGAAAVRAALAALTGEAVS